ncbi:hypothetical protein FOVSG1_013410 [Fusarium oxysporum f. sp. vasinfectum]
MLSKFEPFEITDVIYKEINGKAFTTSILVPKSLKSASAPLLAHFHGGGLIVGDRMFEPWFPLWLLQFAESQGAIVVSPDYRLLPEATGLDILEDVKDFWGWVKGSLPSQVSDISNGLSLDLNRIAVAGESAGELDCTTVSDSLGKAELTEVYTGGYLSLQSALLYPEVCIKLVMAQYGTLDFAHPAYNPKPATTLSAEASLTTKYIRSIKPGSIRLSSIPPQQWDLCLAILSEGRHRELVGNDDKIYIVKNLENAKRIPAMWLVHGNEDTTLPSQTGVDFVKKVKELHPNASIRFNVLPGGHGFDVMSTLEDDWVKEGVKFCSKYW